MVKLNIGSGFQRYPDFINIDCVQCTDTSGATYTDVICDIERERLPYEDNSVDEIVVSEVLEHLGHGKDNPDKLDALIWAMNEMWRVLKPEGILRGSCPSETGHHAYSDPTHQRLISKATFDYFTGVNRFNSEQPVRPRNANYGTKPWYKISVDSSVCFILRPRKTKNYDRSQERMV